jgi:hypothetical protein
MNGEGLPPVSHDEVVLLNAPRMNLSKLLQATAVEVKYNGLFQPAQQLRLASAKRKAVPQNTTICAKVRIFFR